MEIPSPLAAKKVSFHPSAGAFHTVGLEHWPGFFRLPGELLANARKIHRASGMKGIKHKLKFIVRGLASPRLTRDWFDLWQAPELAPLAQSHPRVLLKLQRPYLRRGLDARASRQILQQHYCFIVKQLSAAALAEIFTAPGALLAGMTLDGIGRFSVRLFYHDLYEKEGELSLIFYDEQKQARAFVLSFCVSACQPECREIFVGGLQGFKAANERESVVAVTRGLFGLRPKALLLFALQQLAVHWDVQSIRAVSNETRNLRHRRRAISADYDQFWLESGSDLDANGDFILPLAFVPRKLETIRPNKRAMYRHRYETLANLSSVIQQNLYRLDGQPSGYALAAA